jgi:hypothetical protein
VIFKSGKTAINVPKRKSWNTSTFEKPPDGRALQVALLLTTGQSARLIVETSDC